MVTAEVFQLPVAVPAVGSVEDQFTTEEARQAYFAGYADAVKDFAGVDVGLLASTDPAIRRERARRRLHLSIAT